MISFAVAAVAAVSLATAEITVGARGIFGIGLGTTLSDKIEDSGNDLDLGGTLSVGGTAFVKIPIVASLVVQPELGFTYNMVGMKTDMKVDGYDAKVTMGCSYNAIDIPVLVGWDFKVGDNLTVTPLLGPKISIPIGRLAIETEASVGNVSVKESKDYDIDSPVLFSIVVGAGVAYKVGPGAIVGDLRYNIGVSSLKMKEDSDVATPRGLQLSVGYQISF